MLQASIASGREVRLQAGDCILAENGDDADANLNGMDTNCVTVSGVEGFVLSGAGRERSGLLAECRYVDVLTLIDCRHVRIRNLRIGHTQGGECGGGVVRLENCRDVRIERCDLFGCGTVGLAADGVEGLALENTIIRDCSYQIMRLNRCPGVVIRNSVFRGNGGHQMIELREASDAAIESCHIIDNHGRCLFYIDKNSRCRLSRTRIDRNTMNETKLGDGSIQMA